MKTYQDYKASGLFTEAQLNKILFGLEKNVDVSVFADPKYDITQMSQICAGMIAGVDHRLYANPKYKGWMINDIVWMKSYRKIDISYCMHPNLTREESNHICDLFIKDRNIKKMLKSGVDTSVIKGYVELKLLEEQL